LEDGTFYRLGGTKLHKVDVRIITATNKILEEQVEKGLFRKDLFYRINVIPISIPPLRERKEDIIPLTHYFLKSYEETHDMTKKEISMDVFKLFDAFNWSGNVRELKNQIERLIILSGKNKMINADLLLSTKFKVNSISRIINRRSKERNELRDILKTVDRRVTENELKKAKWNKTIASRNLGMSRASLNNRIERFNIKCEE
jgi:transcriptional regulator with PAS, ATPase and Fis domain